MNTQTAAEKIQVSVSTIRRWCRTGRIQAVKAGRVWVIEPASLPIEKETKMQFELKQTRTGWDAYDTVNGYAPYFGANRDEMVSIVERLNAGLPATEKKTETAATDFTSKVMGDSFGLRSHARPGQCHYCGLNARTCDCH